ncbi:DUF3307 domain-containing protein [Lutibacter sp. B1]|uniref:DUF3307 domain-containing protein n=1 Tax=Lutibacter sp. B1 TaxID=2725996 RepID=UPI0014573838|nr:DUF3307 domain-containing protein [Lutibacter sp. B1]NLP56840.1 DUF3307 domain-containing protein [Lutibacter sp. B1]
MLVLSLKLVLAHIVGDFLLQPDSWIKDKEEKKIKSHYLYWHLLVHFLALLVVLQFNFKYIAGVLVIVLSHFCIDVVKLYLNNKFFKTALFFIDQLLHFLVITAVVYFYKPFTIQFSKVFEPTTILTIIVILVLTKVTSIVMKVIISKWNPENEDVNSQNTSKSLNNAGSYIGMLERLFIFGFILANQWSGIGFLLAAKSVFRFGDLSKAMDRKLTEYILIGTLLSFGLAILITKGYQYVYKIVG